ncbi:glycosyltransferase family 2 protein [Nocardia thraciensis]
MISETGRRPRYAVVTPYFEESRALLRRCIDSVQAQTVAVDHILVADGAPQSWIDAENVRHIRLDRNHGDYGNTPRGIGAMLAMSEQFAGIGFLDADNWLEPGHIAACEDAARCAAPRGRVDYVIARRSMRRLDGTPLPVQDEPIDTHVDTSCLFLLPGSYDIIPYLGRIPRTLSVIGDRIFYATLRHHGLRAAVNTSVTVNYHCLWSVIYEAAGEQPPPEAKPNPPWGDIRAWLGARSQGERQAIRRMCGTERFDTAGAVSPTGLQGVW